MRMGGSSKGKSKSMGKTKGGGDGSKSKGDNFSTSPAILMVICALGIAAAAVAFPMVFSQATNQPQPGHRTANKTYISRCDFEVVQIKGLDAKGFQEKVAKSNAPVLLQFSGGVEDFTDPSLWELKALSQNYGHAKVGIGISDLIVRARGSGAKKMKLSTFIAGELEDTGEQRTDREPPYVFDPTFFNNFSSTLQMPEFLSTSDKTHTSLFFVGKNSNKYCP